MANEKQSLAKKLEHGLEYFIFASRWVQAPIYVALILAAIAYAWKSVQELLHLLTGFAAATESSIMVGILSLVDISMVANLVNMVVVGGYVTFVSRIDRHHRDRRHDRGDVGQPGEGDPVAGHHPRGLPRLDDPLRLGREDAAHRSPLSLWRGGTSPPSQALTRPPSVRSRCLKPSTMASLSGGQSLASGSPAVLKITSPLA